MYKYGKNFANLSCLKKNFEKRGRTKKSKLSLMCYFCNKCQHKTNSKLNLADYTQEKHLLRDVDINKYSKCDNSCLNSSNVERRLKFCGQAIDLNGLLEYFYCHHCKYKTDRKLNLARHIQAKHFPRDLSLNSCSQCAKSFSERSGLQVHLKICGQTESSLKYFSCHHCQYKTNYKSSLSRHIQTKHLPRNLNLNKCVKCEKNYSTETCLRAHSKMCGLSEDLKRSMMRLSCEHCQYKTNIKSDLSRHMQAKHLSYKPKFNKCVKCGKNYSCKSNLTKHFKVCGESGET